MMAKSPVFEALFEYWRRVKNPAAKQSISRLLLDAKAKQAEIDVLRAERAKLRATDTLRPELDGTLMTGAMHQLEVDACRMMCPDLRIGRGTAKERGWEWVLRQPWGRDLSAAPLGRQFH
jgi:membrane-bound lytic murein transglycosylase MltF